MVDYNGLENRRAERHRGFESLSLRKAGVTKVAPACVMSEVGERVTQVALACLRYEGGI